MGQVYQVWFMHVAQPLSVENLQTYRDAFELLPDFNDWQQSPEKYGLRTGASRNGWHQSALDQMAKGLGIHGLEFLLSGHFVCLRPDELDAVANGLDYILGVIAGGIPNLGAYESHDIEELRLPKNRNAFRNAAPAFNGRYDDSAESFYSFVKSLKQTVDEARAQRKYLLYLRPLP